MGHKIESRVLAEQPTVVIRGSVRTSEIGAWIQQAYGELFAYLGSIGVAPAGPPFARYTFRDDGFGLEAGVPVGKVVARKGRVEPSSLPGGSVAATLHVGPYDTIGPAYDELVHWVRAEKHKPTGPHWERYLNSPAEEPDPSRWQTEVLLPYE